MSKNKINSQLIKDMEQLDINGIKFAQAKKILLAKGYKEAEIDNAVYSAPFDKKSNAPKLKHPKHDFFHKNPKLADSEANKLLSELKANESRSSNVSSSDRILANSPVGHHARWKNAYHDAEVAGIPFYTTLFLSAIWLIICFKFNLLDPWPHVGVVAIMAFFYLKNKFL